MSYTVRNGTATPILLNQFEGATYYIGVGDTLEVESHRAALTLEDFGASIDAETKADAINAEEERIRAREEGRFDTDLSEGTTVSSSSEGGVDTHIEGVEGAALGKGVVEDDPEHVTEDGDEVGTDPGTKSAAVPLNPEPAAAAPAKGRSSAK